MKVRTSVSRGAIDDAGVVYLLTGPAHGPRMVASLYSLRRHYDGPVRLFTTQPASHAIGDRCAADERLRVEHRRFPQVQGRKNSSFLTKIAVLASQPYRTTLYLDADTLVAGSVDELFELADHEDFGVTQFANWRTTKRVMRRRIEAWRNVASDRFDPTGHASLIEDALADQPAINAGVVVLRTDRPAVRHWRDLAVAGRNTFICDEIALQLITARYAHRVFDCRFNCSPVCAKGTKDVRIWHFHGERHLRAPECRAIWLPAFEEAARKGVADLGDWASGADPDLTRYGAIDRVLSNV